MWLAFWTVEMFRQQSDVDFLVHHSDNSNDVVAMLVLVVPRVNEVENGMSVNIKPLNTAGVFVATRDDSVT